MLGNEYGKPLPTSTLLSLTKAVLTYVSETCGGLVCVEINKAEWHDTSTDKQTYCYAAQLCTKFPSCLILSLHIFNHRKVQILLINT